MARKKARKHTSISFFAFQDIITAVSGILIAITLMLVIMIEPPGVTVDVVPVANDLAFEDLQKKREEAEKKNLELEKKRAAFLGMAPQQVEAEINQMQESLAEEQEKKKALQQQANDEAAAAMEQDEKLGLNARRQQVEAEKSKVSSLESRKKDLQGEVERLNGDKQAKADELGKARNTLMLVPGKSKERPLVCILGGAEVSLVDPDKAGQKTVLPLQDLAGQLQSTLSAYSPQNNYVVFMVRPSGVPRLDDLKAVAQGAGFAVGLEPLREDVNPDFGAAE